MKLIQTEHTKQPKQNQADRQAGRCNWEECADIKEFNGGDKKTYLYFFVCTTIKTSKVCDF